jgi:hypothetical protein
VNADWLGPEWATPLLAPRGPEAALAAARCLRDLVPLGFTLCTDVHPTGCTLVSEGSLRATAFAEVGTEDRGLAGVLGKWAHSVLCGLVYLLPDLAPLRNTPPRVLYHGTKPSALPSIKTHGLRTSVCTRTRQCLVSACIRLHTRARVQSRARVHAHVCTCTCACSCVHTGPRPLPVPDGGLRRVFRGQGQGAGVRPQGRRV